MRAHFALAAAQVSLIQLRYPAVAGPRDVAPGPEFHVNLEDPTTNVLQDPSYRSNRTRREEDHYIQLASLGPRENAETIRLVVGEREGSLSGTSGNKAEQKDVCPEPNEEPLLKDLEFSKGKHVAKTVFEGPRLVFVAGLEGTGHHLFKEILHLEPSGFDQGVYDLFEERQKSVCGPLGSLGENCGPAQDSREFLLLRQELLKNLTSLHSRDSQFSVSGTVYGLFHNNLAPFSYPCYRHEGRAILTHPDVRVLAEVAEEAKIDLRVVVLTRSARAMLYSTVKHRNFCTGGSAMARQANYLIHNAQILQAQLSRVDKEFLMCAPFEELPDLPEEVADFYDTALGEPAGYTHSLLSREMDRGSTRDIEFTDEEEELAALVQNSADGIAAAAQC
jgi:hypothetical protein